MMAEKDQSVSKLFGGDEEVAEPKKKRSVLKLLFFILVLLVIVIALFLVGSGYRYSVYTPNARMIKGAWEEKYLSSGNENDPDSALKVLSKDNKQLKKAYDAFVPRGEYIVIDSINNRLYLRKNGTNLLDATCSAGSGAILADTPSGRKWVFDTPRGEFKVLNKTENPVWKKPDWAFIEEGKPIPRNDSERYEYGMLGEYALYFSKDGYLIHGTLYERLLGRGVTHGCIRLGRDDLRFLYKNTRIGTKVYAY